MSNINVFRDNEGGYVVTTANEVAPGIDCWQLAGSRVDAAGGPIAALRSCSSITLMSQAGTLAEDEETASLIDSLEFVFVESVDDAHLAGFLS
nr:MAG: hypothetical protein [Bacteriophage sp.]